MSHLQTLQQHMLQAVLADRPGYLRELCSDARADASTRFDVYRYGYRVRLRDALATEFPGLGLMAGRRFRHMLESYVEAHPSGHYNIRWHGAGVAAFLEYGLPWREQPMLADMARLDWAISTTFDAVDEGTLDATGLAEVPVEAWPDLRLRLHRHLQILSSSSNIEAFRRAADAGAARPRLRRYERPRHLLVWRQSLDVRYRLIEDDEHAALAGAMRDEPFAQLCERLAGYHAPAEAMPRMASLLHQWLDAGMLRAFQLP